MSATSERVNATHLIEFINKLEGNHLSAFVNAAISGWRTTNNAIELFTAANAGNSFMGAHSIEVLSRGNTLVMKVTNNDSQQTQVLNIRKLAVNVTPAQQTKFDQINTSLLAPVHASKVVGDYLIEVTDYYENGSVQTLCQNKSENNQQRYHEGTVLFSKMCNALTQIEASGLCFTDAKAANWLLTSELNLIIADTKSLKKNSTRLTTRGYKPPAINISTKAGISAVHSYILGANLYYYLTGKHPQHAGPLNQAPPFLDNNNQPLTEFNTPIGQLYKQLIQGLTQVEPEKRLSLEQADKLLNRIASLSQEKYLTILCEDPVVTQYIDATYHELTSKAMSSAQSSEISNAETAFNNYIEERTSKSQAFNQIANKLNDIHLGQFIFSELIKERRDEFESLPSIGKQTEFLTQFAHEIESLIVKNSQHLNESANENEALQQAISNQRHGETDYTALDKLIAELKSEFATADTAEKRQQIIKKVSVAQTNFNAHAKEITSLVNELNAFKAKCQKYQFPIPKSIEQLSHRLFFYQPQSMFEKVTQEVTQELAQAQQIDLPKFHETVDDLDIYITKDNPIYLQVKNKIKVFDDINHMQEEFENVKKVGERLEELDDELEPYLSEIKRCLMDATRNNILCLRLDNRFRKLNSYEQIKEYTEKAKQFLENNNNPNDPNFVINLHREFELDNPHMEKKPLSFSQQAIVNEAKSNSSNSPWSDFISLCAQLSGDIHFLKVKSQSFRSERTSRLLELSGLDNQQQLISAVSVVLYTLGNPIAASSTSSMFGTTKALSDFVEMFNEDTSIDPKIKQAVRKAVGIAPNAKLNVDVFKKEELMQSLITQGELFIEPEPGQAPSAKPP